MILMAKTGLFFAKADGKYDRREKRFIEEFIAFARQDGEMVADVETIMSEALNRSYTLDEIVKETRQLLDGSFTDVERKAIVQALTAFAETIIQIDGNVAAPEAKNFESWRTAIA